MKAAFITKLKASMLDSARAFAEDDYERYADMALLALSQIKPKRCTTVLALVAGCSLYECPNNLNRIHACYWGLNHKAVSQPWDDDYIGRLPEWSVTHNEKGVRLLRASPAPSGMQISIIGQLAELEYHSSWAWEDIGLFEHLLMLRAQAEAMRELASKNATTAYNLREGISATPKNGTPAYLYEQLLSEFERLAAK